MFSAEDYMRYSGKWQWERSETKRRLLGYFKQLEEKKSTEAAETGEVAEMDEVPETTDAAGTREVAKTREAAEIRDMVKTRHEAREVPEMMKAADSCDLANMTVAAEKREEEVFSTMSIEEHAEYMRLHQYYGKKIVSNCSPAMKEEICRLIELHTKAVEEQWKFARLWSRTPGLYRDTLADGADSWSKAQLGELKSKLPKGPWVPELSVGSVLLQYSGAVSACFQRHIGHKAGRLVQPELNCVLSLPVGSVLPQGESSKPLLGRGDSAPAAPIFNGIGKEAEDGGAMMDDITKTVVMPSVDEELASWCNARVVMDVETLLLDWHGVPWLLPFTVAEGGVISFGTVLPSGGVRDWNARFLNRAVQKWIEDHQENVENSLLEPSCPAALSGGTATGYIAPGTQVQGHVWRDLWEVMPNGKRLLLRHQAWTDSSQSDNLCTVVAKPEYQPEFGAEDLSRAENEQQMVWFLLCPRMLRVRVEVPTCRVVFVEEVEKQECERERLDTLFGMICELTEQLCRLAPGTYLLSHEAGDLNAQVLVLGQGSGLDLHEKLWQCSPQAPTSSVSNDGHPPPLDVKLYFPLHYQRARAPLTFPPAEEGNRS